jgi:hypothetical protein
MRGESRELVDRLCGMSRRGGLGDLQRGERGRVRADKIKCSLIGLETKEEAYLGKVSSLKPTPYENGREGDCITEERVEGGWDYKYNTRT